MSFHQQLRHAISSCIHVDQALRCPLSRGVAAQGRLHAANRVAVAMHQPIMLSAGGISATVLIYKPDEYSIHYSTGRRDHSNLSPGICHSHTHTREHWTFTRCTTNTKPTRNVLKPGHAGKWPLDCRYMIDAAGYGCRYVRLGHCPLLGHDRSVLIT